MSDIWRPSEEENNLIYSFALQNCLEHGQAQMGSIMGKLSKDFDMKKYGRLLPRYVIAQVNKANSLMQREGEEAVRNELMRIDASKFERLEREKVKIERTFPDLPNVKEGNFKVRFAPNPNAPLTVGHMRGVLINNYYADKYGGDFILRFDDTSTDVKPPILDAYVQILEDAYWLTGKAPDEVLIASDRMDIYYDHAQQLISLNGAYMCDCKNFKELKDASQPCPHRQLSIKENLDLFNQMVEGKFPAGKWVLRAKTDLDAPNPAHRDFVLFRVQKNAHPRTGDSYKAWPMLDFQSAIDDNLTGVTHIIRGIDLMDSTEKQKILYNILDWDYPETTYWGRVKILDQDGKEVKFSSSQYAKDIAEGKFDGWDDKRLYTVQAFKKRGYTPDALLEWWLEYGLTRKPITVSMKTLDTLQRRKGKMEAESFEADYYPYTWNTGQKCESCDNGEIMETEHAYKSSTLSCDKCDYSEEMVWDGESFEAEEFNAINISNTTLSTYGRKRHRKFDHRQSRRHNFGMAFCAECGELFTKNHPQRKYCYGDCAKIVQARQVREFKRQQWANMPDEERQDYYRRQWAVKRANMTDEEKEERNRMAREYARKRYANRTDEEIEEWNRKQAVKKANMTDEEKEERNRKQREYWRERYANMTDEAREARRRIQRERYAKKKEMGAEETFLWETDGQCWNCGEDVPKYKNYWDEKWKEWSGITLDDCPECSNPAYRVSLTYKKVSDYGKLDPDDGKSWFPLSKDIDNAMDEYLGIGHRAGGSGLGGRDLDYYLSEKQFKSALPKVRYVCLNPPHGYIIFASIWSLGEDVESKLLGEFNDNMIQKYWLKRLKYGEITQKEYDEWVKDIIYELGDDEDFQKEWSAEDGGIEYKYALVAKYPNFDMGGFNIPDGLDAIGKNHITIVSGKALKPVKKIVKNNKDNLLLLPPPPEPKMGNEGVAMREVDGEMRETYFMKIANQDDFQDYANLVCASLGIENPEPKRFFHLSIANNHGGDSFKSVGDIKLEDLSGEN